MNKVVVITGPTAVGKTKLSVEIAKRFNTDLINADAYQIYKNMNIGTAKPSTEEQQNIKHHLLDYLETTDEFSISDYQKIVRQVIDEMIKNNKLPILVGGSGLYIDSVVNEYHFDEEKRIESNEYDNLTNEELHKVLEELDYDVSTKIHPNNRKRVLRAIELAQTGENESRTLKNEFVYDALVIFLNDERTKLYERINQRVDKMISRGLLGEVENLIKHNLTPDNSQSMRGIGYKEIYQYFNNEIDLPMAIDKIKQHTRNYAKRQITWFKRYTNINWISTLNLDTETIINNIINLLKKPLI